MIALESGGNFEINSFLVPSFLVEDCTITRIVFSYQDDTRQEILDGQRSVDNFIYKGLSLGQSIHWARQEDEESGER